MNPVKSADKNDKALRVPPNNLDAEMCLLSNEILMEEMIDEIADAVTPEDFYNDCNATIQRTLLKMRADQSPIDFLTVMDRLRADGLLEDVGGAYRFLEIEKKTPHRIADVRYALSYADAIVKESRRRQAIEAAELLGRQAWDEKRNIDGIVESLSKTASLLMDRMKIRTPWKSLRDHEIEVAGELAEGRQPTRYIGIRELDDAVDGVANGENVVIAGETMHGKTMVCLQWLDCASFHGVKSLFISKEMSGKALATRRLSGSTDLPKDSWYSHNSQLVEDINRRYENRADIIVGEECDTISDVERAIERAVRDHGIGVVALDYVQLVKGDGQNREQQVADVSRRWKRALVKHDIIGLLLAQVNSEAFKDKRRPRLQDIRETKAIGHDADLAVFVYWEAKHNTAASPFLYRLLIEKTRQRGLKVPVIEMRVDPVKQWLFPIRPEDSVSQSAIDF